MSARLCAWRDCSAAATGRGACRRHLLRSYAAGTRASTGAARDVVLAEVTRRDRSTAPTASTVDRLEDLEWLLDGGVNPDRAAARVGWARDTALAIARRHGRDDLAEKFLRRSPARLTWGAAA